MCAIFGRLLPNRQHIAKLLNTSKHVSKEKKFNVEIVGQIGTDATKTCRRQFRSPEELDTRAARDRQVRSRETSLTCLKYAGNTHLWSSNLELWAFSSSSKRSVVVPLSLVSPPTPFACWWWCCCTVVAIGVLLCHVVPPPCCLLGKREDGQPSNFDRTADQHIGTLRKQDRARNPR